MLHVTVNQDQIRGVINRFASTPNQVALARASALRKMRQRLQTGIKRDSAKQLRMPQKAIAGRFFSDPVKQGDTVLKVWIGTHPVSPFNIGTVRLYGIPGKTGGVKAGRRTYRGAFLASIYSARQKVWIRQSSKHYSPELYPTRRRPGDRGLMDEGLRGRFPVIRAAVPIDEIVAKVVERDGAALLAEYTTVFQQEFNYYTNIRGK